MENGKQPQKFLKEPLHKNEKDKRVVGKLSLKTVMFLEDLVKIISKATGKKHMLVLQTACFYVHRFYSIHSYEGSNRCMIAMGCLFLAAKFEEVYIHLSSLLMAYGTMLKDPNYSNKSPLYLEIKAQFYKDVVEAERSVLQTLCFDLNFLSPLPRILNLITTWKFPPDVSKHISAQTFEIESDSFRSDVCMHYSAPDIAHSVLFLTSVIREWQSPAECAKYANNTTLPPGQSWFEYFTKLTPETTIKDICFRILDEHDDKTKVKNKLKAFFSAAPLAVKINVEKHALTSSPLNPSISPSPGCDSSKASEEVIGKDPIQAPLTTTGMKEWGSGLKMSKSMSDMVGLPKAPLAVPLAPVVQETTKTTETIDVKNETQKIVVETSKTTEKIVPKQQTTVAVESVVSQYLSQSLNVPPDTPGTPGDSPFMPPPPPPRKPAGPPAAAVAATVEISDTLTVGSTVAVSSIAVNAAEDAESKEELQRKKVRLS